MSVVGAHGAERRGIDLIIRSLLLLILIAPYFADLDPNPPPLDYLDRSVPPSLQPGAKVGLLRTREPPAR